LLSKITTEVDAEKRDQRNWLHGTPSQNGKLLESVALKWLNKKIVKQSFVHLLVPQIRVDVQNRHMRLDTWWEDS